MRDFKLQRLRKNRLGGMAASKGGRASFPLEIVLALHDTIYDLQY